MLSPVAWLCIVFNVASALSIVFANKAVFAVFSFPFPVLLTWIHTIVTMVGMQLMCMVRFAWPRERLAVLWHSWNRWATLLEALEQKPYVDRIALLSNLSECMSL
jgi:hypothetical protein